jgi:phospholipid/cholesterol/gamma-HCH transport system substrate-binding protein
MLYRKLELAVGFFLVAGFVAFAVLAFQVSGLAINHQQQTYSLHASFTNASGLSKRAKVSAAGVVIGSVTDIRLDPFDFKAVVTMAIDKKVDFLTTDSIAAIQTAGVLGEKYVSISIGGEEQVLADGDEIEDTASAIVLEELIGKVLTSLGK